MCDRQNAMKSHQIDSYYGVFIISREFKQILLRYLEKVDHGMKCPLAG